MQTQSLPFAFFDNVLRYELNAKSVSEQVVKVVAKALNELREEDFLTRDFRRSTQRKVIISG